MGQSTGDSHANALKAAVEKVLAVRWARGPHLHDTGRAEASGSLRQVFPDVRRTDAEVAQTLHEGTVVEVAPAGHVDRMGACGSSEGSPDPERRHPVSRPYRVHRVDDRVGVGRRSNSDGGEAWRRGIC